MKATLGRVLPPLCGGRGDREKGSAQSSTWFGLSFCLKSDACSLNPHALMELQMGWWESQPLSVTPRLMALCLVAHL